MNWDEAEDTTTYLVVINHEEQYSIWPDYKEIPNGWRAVGESGPKQTCLDYIDKVWTDMRPLSLRKQMEESKAANQPIEQKDTNTKVTKSKSSVKKKAPAKKKATAKKKTAAKKKS